jgi:hypothetical protein
LKKLIFIFIILASTTLSLKAQPNPVQELIWNHYYIYPNNCFGLGWSEPEISTDTLLGYNIYRDNELYMFTTETNLGCTYCETSVYDPFCNFIDFNNGTGFTICVKAVYKGDIESECAVATCEGIMINIDKINKNTTSFNSYISGSILNIDLNNFVSTGKLDIVNINGQTVYNCTLKENQSKQIDISNFSKGVYFIKITGDKVFRTEKIVVK